MLSGKDEQVGAITSARDKILCTSLILQVLTAQEMRNSLNNKIQVTHELRMGAFLITTNIYIIDPSQKKTKKTKHKHNRRYAFFMGSYCHPHHHLVSLNI